jgi:hypothetical protein
MFNNISSDPLILPNKTKLNCLLYADDLVILSRSKIGLQNCLDQLNNWCKQWLMQINLNKTKIMVLQKSNQQQLIPKFNIGDKTLQFTQKYTYLRLKLTPTGKI